MLSHLCCHHFTQTAITNITNNLQFIKPKADFSLIYLIYLFIFGCVGSSLLCAGFLQLRPAGASLCCGAQASHCSGFSCWEARALGAWAQQLWPAGSRAQAQQLVAHRLSCSVAPSRTRARTCVPYIGRRILNHCTTKEAPKGDFSKCYFYKELSFPPGFGTQNNVLQ